MKWIALCIVPLIALSFTAPGFGQSPHPWPMFRHDPAHTAASTLPGPSVPSLIWSFNPSPPESIPYDGVLSTAAVSSNGSVYVGAFDNNFYCLTSCGTIAWSYMTNDYVLESAALGVDGSVYVGSRTQFYSLTPSGALAWSYNAAALGISSPTIGPGGTIHIGSDTNNLFSFTSSGSLAWSYEAADYIDSSPAVGGDGRVYYGSDDYNFYVISSNGALSWSYASDDWIGSSAVLAHGGRAYVSGDDDVLYTFAPTGSLVWSYHVRSGGFGTDSSPALTGAGNIYAASGDSNFYCLTPSGSLAWSFKIPDLFIASPVVDANDIGYVGGGGGRLYAFTSNGTLMWTYKADTGSSLSSALAIGNDRRIFISSIAFLPYFGGGGGFQCIAEPPTPTPTIPSLDIIPSSNSPAIGDPFTVDVTVKPVGGAFDAWAVILAPGGRKFSFYLSRPSSLRKGMSPLALNVGGLKQPYSRRLLSLTAIPRGTAGTYTIIGGLVPAGRRPTIANAIPDYLDKEVVVIH